MKRLIVCLVLLLCAMPCAAQTASGPFADIPPNSWPFAAVDTIQKAGIVFGYPDGTYGGRRATTRYEFAVAIARLLAQTAPLSPSESSNLATDVSIRLKSSPPALNALIALVNEFRPELSRLGQDVPKALAWLNIWQQQQQKDIQDGKLVLTPEQMHSPFAHFPFDETAWLLAQPIEPPQDNQPLPADHWAYSAFATLDDAGVSPFQAHLAPGERLTPNQFAGLISFWVYRLPTVPSEPVKANGAFSAGGMDDNERWEERLRFQYFPQALPALTRLVGEFAPQLRRQGIDVPLAQERLAWLATKPFPDVPKRHWAADATVTLRQYGLLTGYPQGTFTVME